MFELVSGAKHPCLYHLSTLFAPHASPTSGYQWVISCCIACGCNTFFPWQVSDSLWFRKWRVPLHVGMQPKCTTDIQPLAGWLKVGFVGMWLGCQPPIADKLSRQLQ
jgi:hypothetical protein